MTESDDERSSRADWGRRANGAFSGDAAFTTAATEAAPLADVCKQSLLARAAVLSAFWFVWYAGVCLMDRRSLLQSIHADRLISGSDLRSCSRCSYDLCPRGVRSDLASACQRAMGSHETSVFDAFVSGPWKALKSVPGGT